MPMNRAQEMTSLAIIDEWFRGKCNGIWEHRSGFTLESTDNPGWLVTIDMDRIRLESVPGWREGAEAHEVEVQMSDGKIRIWSESLIPCLDSAVVLIIHEKSQNTSTDTH